MNRLSRLVVSLCALTVVGSAQATTYNFTLDGLQEVPPVSTPGIGTGIVSLVDQSPAADDWMLTWNISYSGLIGTDTAAHFHGAAPVGGTASPRITLTIGSPMIGNQLISDAWANEIQTGQWYVNVHTTFKTGGEIRGQVVPEPNTLLLLGLAGAVGLRRR